MNNQLTDYEFDFKTRELSRAWSRSMRYGYFSAEMDSIEEAMGRHMSGWQPNSDDIE